MRQSLVNVHVAGQNNRLDPGSMAESYHQSTGTESNQSQDIYCAENTEDIRVSLSPVSQD